MRRVQHRIEEQQRAFAEHAFFAELDGAPSFPDAMHFAPALTFWVMAFQDVLRLCDERTRDPVLKKIVRHHRAEDAGHQRWFLQDLARLHQQPPDARTLFSDPHTPTRDAVYALVSEVYRTEDDRLRVVLLLTLESAGHIFFERVARVVERAGLTPELRYFSFSHLEIEKKHEMFEAEMNRQIASIDMPDAVARAAVDLVDRCYAAFHAMFDGLVRARPPLKLTG